MPFVYNVHTPSKTFATQHKDGEEYSALVSRIASKAGLTREDATALQEGKDGAGLVYEFEGSRWSLEDDDDLQIFFSRLPPSSTSSATLHLTPPHPHARFSIPASPSKPSSYTAASALKDKTKSASSPSKAKSAKPAAKSTANGDSNSEPKIEKAQDSQPPVKLSDYASGDAAAAGSMAAPLGNPAAAASSKKGSKVKSATSTSGISAPNHHFPQGTHGGHSHDQDKAPESSALAPPAKGETKEVVGHTEGKRGYSLGSKKATPSIHSTMSRKSKYGDDNAEPMWEVKKRAWNEFHNGNGVRTVLGKVGDVDNVRMLLKPGHRNVYVSRSFAIKNGLVDKQYAMGASGYTGLKSIGLIPITVAGKTAQHRAMVSEEMHFDVVLGRAWVEKMNIKVDPIDQTILTYMDNGNPIPCDIVVLKDAQGNKIHIT